LEDFLVLHEDACNLLGDRQQTAARLIHNAMSIIDEDFAREVLTVSPKYCASLPDEYINSAMKFVPALKELGYFDVDLAKEDVFWTDAIKKVHPHGHHYAARV
jgi:NitT/TauT family transport system substrate-binding protein